MGASNVYVTIYKFEYVPCFMIYFNFHNFRFLLQLEAEFIIFYERYCATIMASLELSIFCITFHFLIFDIIETCEKLRGYGNVISLATIFISSRARFALNSVCPAEIRTYTSCSVRRVLSTYLVNARSEKAAEMIDCGAEPARYVITSKEYLGYTLLFNATGECELFSYPTVTIKNFLSGYGI